MGKNIVTFGADMSSSVHIDNTNKDILILGEGATQAFSIDYIPIDNKDF